MEATGSCAKQGIGKGAAQQGSRGISTPAVYGPARAHERAMEDKEALQHNKRGRWDGTGDGAAHHGPRHVCVRMCVCVGAQAVPCQRLTLGVGSQCSPGGGTACCVG